MRPSDHVPLVEPPHRRTPSAFLTLSIAFVCLAATGAVLAWNAQDFRQSSPAAARAAADATDEHMRTNAIVLMGRDAVESIAVLRRLRDEGGAGADQAAAALHRIEEALR